MALTAQEEIILKAMATGLTVAEATALSVAAQERNLQTLLDTWTKKKAALDVAIGNYQAAINDGFVALKSADATQIAAAKTAIQTAKQALTAALEAAK